MKVALIFDNQPRPETTGFYCRRALGKLADVEHLLPDELDHVPANLFDLFVLVDDGLDYPIPDCLRPKAAWVIDTHVDLRRSLARFGDADYLFAAQRNGASTMSKMLGKTVEWLPLACDPAFHRPLADTTKEYNLAFVGHFLGDTRQQLLEELRERFSPTCFTQALFDEMAQVYSKAHVGFNCSIADDLNMRLFEIPAHGIPLVTNSIDDNGLTELFTPNEHLFVYKDRGELLDTIEHLLKDDGLRRKVSRAGLQHVVAHHTYDHRMRQLLQTVTVRHSQELAGKKAVGYFEFDRPEVRALVPHDAKHVLDVGCAAGGLGASLKSERGVHVTGIEVNAAVAQKASDRLDRVINQPIDEIIENAFGKGEFDCMVFADVLEHLRDPGGILRKCRRWLNDEGSIVISVPNSRHHSVVSGLIDGNWTYERAGLLDEDHVRCFTRRETEKLLFRCGYEIDELQCVAGSGHREWQAAGCPGEVRIGRLHIGGLCSAEAEEFYTYQYLLRARPTPKQDYGLTSIVIVTWNELAYTRECIDSILSRTDEPIELIFVDNGSTDGTPEYLETIPGATVIRNSENRGFAPAVNQGLKECHGQQILLLNNDCVVSTGWLQGLLEVLHDDERNGLVGPVSNNISGPQQIPVSYTDLASMDGFAWDCRANRRLVETDRLVGFCLLFRRSVLDDVGLLDEQFEVGCFEDDDFCRRASKAGYRAIIAPNAFVHHYGSVTFRGAGLDFGEIMQQNSQRYLQKWEHDNSTVESAESVLTQTSMAQPPEYSVVSIPNGEQLLQRKNIRLSLCMIVRDNENTIAECLESIYPWVDEIIIVDTGSNDRTPEICRNYGAQIHEFPWCDDFSAARNESLKWATGEWIFWMDSDDVIPEDQGKRLRKLVYGSHDSECLGYVAQVHCPVSHSGQLTIVDHVKVFRNLPELRFEHRIHEQILPAIRKIGGTVEFTDIYVVHSGSDQSPETRQRKLERDFRILKRDLEDRPDHPFVLFNLGMTYEDTGEYEEAEHFLRRCIEVSGEGESQLRKAWALLVNCLKGQGRRQEALEAASRALDEYPGDKELLFRRAGILQDMGRLDDAVADYSRVLNESAGRVFQSIDPAICGYKAHHNLALVLAQLGRNNEAARHWQTAVEQCPAFDAAWLCLARLRISQHEIEDSKLLLERMPVLPELTGIRAIIKALIHEARGQFDRAVNTLREAWETTGNSDCLDEQARILMEHNNAAEAIPALQHLNTLFPDDPAILHNLGNAFAAGGNHSTAMECLTDSLRARPDNIVVACELAEMQLVAGMPDAAAATLQFAAELNGEHPRIKHLKEQIGMLESGNR